MIKTLTVSDSEKLSYLIEQIKAIIQNARDGVTISLMATKHQIGEEIVTSKLYKKYAKTQSDFFESVSNQTGMKAPTLAECVKLYEAYPNRDPNELAGELFKQHGSWRNARLELWGDVPADGRNIEERPKCNKKCPIHCGNGR